VALAEAFEDPERDVIGSANAVRLFGLEGMRGAGG